MFFKRDFFFHNFHDLKNEKVLIMLEQMRLGSKVKPKPTIHNVLTLSHKNLAINMFNKKHCNCAGTARTLVKNQHIACEDVNEILKY